VGRALARDRKVASLVSNISGVLLTFSTHMCIKYHNEY